MDEPTLASFALLMLCLFPCFPIGQMTQTIHAAFSLPIYQPNLRSLPSRVHVSGSSIQAAEPPRFLLEIDVSKGERIAAQIVHDCRSFLSSVYLPARGKGTSHRTEGDAFAESILFG